jgi:hypothetical protein
MTAMDPYWPLIVGEAPRTLGFLDRDPLSPTAGCGDRTWWAWKFTDFPGGRFQESMCVLAYLYASRQAQNPYVKSEALLGWIDLGLKFWAKCQHADGSHDEAYPFERSLAATAFTAFYIAEALRFLGDDLDPATRAIVRQTLVKSGEWLCRNDERHGVLSNHLAAAAASLEHIHAVTGDDRYRRRSRHFIDRILSKQSREGWYEEYGGADPGYQTHGTFYLARIWQATGDTALLDSLKRSTRFLAFCIHPDGSIGGEYASRNTQTYYPAGFEMLAGVDPSAAAIANRMRPAVSSGAAVGQRSVDAYNYFPLLNNLVFAREAFVAQGDRPGTLEVPREGVTHFPDAGLLRIDRGGTVVMIGSSKGGVVKVFDRTTERLVASDCGLVARLENGKPCATQYLDRTRVVEVDEKRILIRGTLMESARPVMDPMRFLLFRGFMITIGRAPAAARWIKDLLVRVLITRRRGLELQHERTITVGPDALLIEDRVRGADLTQLRELWRGSLFTTVHMGSSRYFVPQELLAVDRTGGLERIELPPGANEIVTRRRVALPA